MNPTEAERAIRARVVVTSQKVTFAKTIILEAATAICTSTSLFDAVAKANDITVPTTVVLHDSVDPGPAINAVGDAFSWRLASVEAIWSLIHAGMLLQLDEASGQSTNVAWTTIGPSGSGESSAWTFEDYSIPVPRRLKRAPSLANVGNQFLAEPDLYLHSLGAPEMHTEVSAAFHEAVRCFRHELFTPALAMLGKASEGAWLELGASLLRLVPEADTAKYSKQRSVLEDPMMGTFRKIEAVLTLYDHQEQFGQVSKQSGVRLQELRSVAVWSDAVRDSRNTIHFDVAPATPNTYEKLAALLLGAVTNIRVLYRVKKAADAIVAAPGTP